MAILLRYRIFFSIVAWIENNRKNKVRHWVTPNCDILLEGFPRSANTFLHRIIRYATKDTLNISHHVHRHEQIIMAMKYNIPSFLLFREPHQAIASYLVRVKGKASVDELLSNYINFAQGSIQAYEKSKEVHFLIFEDIIKSPVKFSNAILNYLNKPANVSTQMIDIATIDSRPEKNQSSLPSKYKENLKLDYIHLITKHPDYEYALHLFMKIKEYSWKI